MPTGGRWYRVVGIPIVLCAATAVARGQGAEAPAARLGSPVPVGAAVGREDSRKPPAREPAFPGPDRLPAASGWPVAGGDWWGTPADPIDPPPDGGPFAFGSTSVQLLAGGYFSGRPGPQVPAFNYLLASARLGWVATPVEDRLIGPGGYELLLDLSGALVTSGGYGDYFAGPSLYVRYNWVQPNARMVPYAQIGAGVVYTDTYKDRTQEAVGQQVEFYTRFEAGLKWFVAPNLSLDVEGGLQHISNAQLAERNLGVNAWGAQIGLTYYFPAGRP